MHKKKGKNEGEKPKITSKSREEEPRIQKFLGSVFLILAILYQIYILTPYLEPGINHAGDNYMHTASIQFIDRQIEKTNTIYGWYNIYQIGQPLLNIYHPLFYLSIIYLHKITLLPLLYSKKIFLILMLSLYPATVFVFLKKLGHPMALCGLASLFSTASNIGWGNNVVTYFYTGPITQSLGMLIFPLALAATYSSLKENKPITLAAVLMVASMLSHLLINFMLMISVMLMSLLFLLNSRPRLLKFYVRKILLIGLCATLLSGFWTAPFLTLKNYSMDHVLAMTGQSQGGYQRNSFTAGRAFTKLVNGNIFDKTDLETKNYNWYYNGKEERKPIFTLFLITGLIISSMKSKDLKTAFLPLGFLVAFMVFCGSDDFTFLTYLPFEDYMYFIRVSAVLEFYAICLAGYGLYHLSKALQLLMTLPVKAFKRPSFFIIILLVSSSLTFYPLAQERYSVSKKMVKTIFDDNIKEMTELFNSTKYLLDGRGYVGEELNYHHHESQPLVASTSGLGFIMTPHWDPHYYTQQMVWRMISQNDNENHLLKGIPYNHQLVDLYNVRYFFTMKNWEKDEKRQSVENELKLLGSSKRYNFYEIQGTPTYFKFIPKKPTLLICSDQTYFKFGIKWLTAYRDMKDYKNLSFYVRPKTTLLDDIELDAKRYPHILLIDYEIEDEKAVNEKLKEYEREGGKIFDFHKTTPEDGAAPLYVKDTWLTIKTPPTPSFDSQPELEFTTTDVHHYSLTYETEEDRFVIFKQSNFDVWDVLVDGNPVTTYETTPGFVGFWVPKGSREIDVSFRIKNKTIGLLLTLLALLILYYIKKTGIHKFNDIDSQYFENKKAFAVLLAIAYLYIGYVIVLQNIYHMPVIESPNQTVEYSIYHLPIKWKTSQVTDSGSYRNLNKDHPDYVQGLKYQLQISETPYTFGNSIVYEENLSNREKFLEEKDLLKPGVTYGIRVRAFEPEKTYSWSEVRYFKAHKNSPNIRPLSIK